MVHKMLALLRSLLKSSLSGTVRAFLLVSSVLLFSLSYMILCLAIMQGRRGQQTASWFFAFLQQCKQRHTVEDVKIPCYIRQVHMT